MSQNPTQSGTIQRLYALNAGIAVVPDQSVYSPGYREGEAITLSCNAYLLRREDEWILWDTGIPDAVAKESGGRVIAHNIRGIVVRTIRAQLSDIGITPQDIGRVILSHAHFDHVGNAAMFRHATWHIQRREYEAMFGPSYNRYGYVPAIYQELKQAKVELMEGDLDIFGDGSVEVLSTPGHTPGHCSLLVRLVNTGTVLLSGDVAHYGYTLKHRCVPSMNSEPENSRRSMERVDAVVQDEGAQLWLNHDIVQTATIAHLPSYFD
ncbi:MAG: N-acyl homoserine lactonase family protein [Kiloniellaceae bacterium]